MAGLLNFRVGLGIQFAGLLNFVLREEHPRYVIGQSLNRKCVELLKEEKKLPKNYLTEVTFAPTKNLQ